MIPDPVGVGMVACDHVVHLLLWLATVMQLAVCRDRGICESNTAGACRWLIVAGSAVIAGRFSWVLWFDGDVQVSAAGLASLSLLSIGLSGLALDRIGSRHRRHGDA